MQSRGLGAELALGRRGAPIRVRLGPPYACWCESGDQVDPVMVGVSYWDGEARAKKYSWSVNRFLMARWGEAIKPFAEVKQLVYDAHIKRERVKLQMQMSNLEFDAMRMFGV